MKLFGNTLGGFQCKFNRIAKLHEASDELAKKLKKFLATDSITHRTECSLATLLLLETGIRIGNEDSANGYISKRKDALGKLIKTYGLTTLLPQHVKIKGNEAVLQFTGKREVAQKITVKNKLIAQELAYLKEQRECGTLFNVSDYELRKFIGKSVGRKFQPKDFRTLKANQEAWNFFKNKISIRTKPKTKKAFNQEVKEVAEYVSTILGNTPSICKRSYIDERFFEYMQQQRLLK